MDDTGIVVGPASRELRRALRPIEWVVLEDVALDARLDGKGDLVAPTSARRVAEHLGLTPGAVARALARLRSNGLVTHARQAGPAGRFGLSAYVLVPIAGLDVIHVPDGDGASPHPARPRLAVPRPAPPHIERPRAVDRHVDAVPADDEAAERVGPDRRSVPENAARSSATRPRQAAARPGAAQLSMLDTSADAELATDPERHP
jgi:DNA-binding transcriptional ArsR family regulator